MQNFLYLFILSGFLFIVNFKYFFNSWCCILDYFILNCKLWDKFLISMIILFLIIFYIQILYRNFELIFEFMALKRAPICGRNVCLSFFLRIFKTNNKFNQRKWEETDPMPKKLTKILLTDILKKIVLIHNRTNIWMNKNNNILQLLTCTTTYLCPKRRLYPAFFNTLLQN